MAHVNALAQDIGPRPAGSPAEATAREYIARTLTDNGITSIETIPFSAPDTWGYAIMIPVFLALVGNAVFKGRVGRLLSGLTSLASAYSLWRSMSSQRSPLAGFAPTAPSATQVVRIAPSDSLRNRIVILAHTDSNKHRPTFSPLLKRFLLLASTTVLLSAFFHGLAQIVRSVGSKNAAGDTYRLSLFGLVVSLLSLWADEREGYVDGANDNASAVACALGLAGHLKANPPRHTEVWVAFTGAEEVGGLGTHALLDAHGAKLADAYFLDFEMVGAGDLAYITHHSGFSFFNSYTPDARSAALAAETARKHPEFSVIGRPMTIVEEVGALRGRGYRGLCLAGVGQDGFLVNWHQYSDNASNIDPACLERAARFGLKLIETLDEK
jgi:hypothetical protein